MAPTWHRRHFLTGSKEAKKSKGSIALRNVFFSQLTPTGQAAAAEARVRRRRNRTTIIGLGRKLLLLADWLCLLPLLLLDFVLFLAFKAFIAVLLERKERKKGKQLSLYNTSA